MIKTALQNIPPHGKKCAPPPAPPKSSSSVATAISNTSTRTPSARPQVVDHSERLKILTQVQVCVPASAARNAEAADSSPQSAGTSKVCLACTLSLEGLRKVQLDDGVEVTTYAGSTSA